MSQAEQRELLRQWKEDGNVAARNKLAMSYFKWVAHCTHKQNQNTPWLEFEDLLSHAYMGLFVAIDKWEPDKGRLSTYSKWWMDSYLERAIKVANKQGATGHVPTFGQPDDLASLEEFLGVDDPDNTWNDSFDRLNDALLLLDPREELIIRHRMRDGTHIELTKRLNLTRERVRQLEQRALSKLRRAFGLSREGAISMGAVATSTVPSARVTPTVEEVTEILLDFVSDNPGTTVKQIASVNNFSEHRARDTLHRLVAEGVVESRPDAAYSRLQRYYVAQTDLD